MHFGNECFFAHHVATIIVSLGVEVFAEAVEGSGEVGSDRESFDWAEFHA